MNGATINLTTNDSALVLVVEDEPTWALMLSNFLNQEEYQVVSVCNGQEALFECEKRLPDIILMDAMLPELDGFRCSQMLAETYIDRCPPILMITSLEDSKWVNYAFEVGAIDYVTKPVHWAVLRQRLRRILKAHQDHQALQASLEKERSLHRQLQIANQELQRLATIDSVTHIANRRVFDERFRYEWKRLRREQANLSVLLIAVDYFPSYNDMYGHLAGDQCLCELAQMIKQVARRPADLVARYGGEEFALILPNTSSQGAVFLAERIRQQLQEKAMKHQASTVSPWVTISVGVATTIPYDDDFQALIQKADEMLYIAKERGRDRVVADSQMLHAFPFQSPFAQADAQ